MTASKTTGPEENIMGTMPIGNLLMKMSVPVILSMLVSTLYNVVDSIFVSRLGENALTAMSLAAPIFSLLACITVGFSVGMNAELSRKLGEGFLWRCWHCCLCVWYGKDGTTTARSKIKIRRKAT